VGEDKFKVNEPTGKKQVGLASQIKTLEKKGVRTDIQKPRALPGLRTNGL
jgi:hypothetical protein